MMRVVQISTSETSGGAALAANRLHKALNARGDVESTMFVGSAQSSGAGVKEFNPVWPGPRGLGRLLFRAGRRLHRSVKSAYGPLFSQEWTSFGCWPLHQLPPADLYHLHWTADLVDFRMLPRLARRAPVVWTLHDMNPFTGGCHYDLECGRFSAQCGSCPILASSQMEDASAATLRRKLAILSAIPNDGLTVVSPSRWMAGESRRSAAFGRFEARVIPNGIDLEVFCQIDRAAARGRLGLGTEDRVVLFVADVLHDTRKGWTKLRQALAAVTQLPRLRVLTLGRGDLQQMSGPAFQHLGQLSEATAIRDAYNAADLFIIPSLQDNFPNTVIESLACGTPVVGFATGGVADAVEHGICGLLAATGDTSELAMHIRRVLTDHSLRAAMGTAARARAVALYGVERQAQTYHALYDELIRSYRVRSPTIAPLKIKKSIAHDEPVNYKRNCY
jgi:glycosyltransferase involved in cell wall biosynthesis